MTTGVITQVPSSFVVDSQSRIDANTINYVIPFWANLSKALRENYTLAKGIDWSTKGVEVSPALENFGHGGSGGKARVLPTNLSETFHWRTSDGEETWLRIEYWFFSYSHQQALSTGHPALMGAWFELRIAQNEKDLDLPESRASVSPRRVVAHRLNQSAAPFANLEYCFKRDVFSIKCVCLSDGRKTRLELSRSLDDLSWITFIRVGSPVGGTERTWAAQCSAGAYSVGSYSMVEENTNALPGMMRTNFYMGSGTFDNSPRENPNYYGGWAVRETSGVWRQAFARGQYPITTMTSIAPKAPGGVETLLGGPVIMSQSGEVWSGVYPGAEFVALSPGYGAEGSEMVIAGAVYRCVNSFIGIHDNVITLVSGGSAGTAAIQNSSCLWVRERDAPPSE